MGAFHDLFIQLNMFPSTFRLLRILFANKYCIESSISDENIDWYFNYGNNMILGILFLSLQIIRFELLIFLGGFF